MNNEYIYIYIINNKNKIEINNLFKKYLLL